MPLLVPPRCNRREYPSAGAGSRLHLHTTPVGPGLSTHLSILAPGFQMIEPARHSATPQTDHPSAGAGSRLNLQPPPVGPGLSTHLSILAPGFEMIEPARHSPTPTDGPHPSAGAASRLHLHSTAVGQRV